MNSILLRIVIPYAAAFIAAYFVARFALAARIRKGKFSPKVGKHAKDERMGVMDKVLIVEAVCVILYVIADFAVFWHTGSEPATLTMSFFAVCGGENGFMAWIKTRKEQERMRKWQYEDGEKQEEYKEDKTL